MRFDGKLDKWNDDRGFGFIIPARGGEPVFVHISAFPRDGRRPQLGEALSFEVEPAGDGKKRAIKVQRPAAQRPGRPQWPASVEPAGRGPRRSGSRRPLAGAAIAVALIAYGGSWAYGHFIGGRGGIAPAAAVDTRAPATPQNETGAFRCDGRIHCSQMTSCEEAKFFLQNCPNTGMDGDGDGIPCEQQWCTGGFGR
jgi:cold shock CspA family protein